MGSPKKRPALQSVNYVVELFLDEQHHIQRSKIHHVQSQEEEAWEGWDGKRLLGFLESREELAIPLTTATPAEPIAAAPEAETQAEPRLPSTPRVVLTPGRLDIEPCRAGESVRIGLAMNLASYPARGPLQYSVQVFAKRVGHRGYLAVVEENGAVPAAPEIVLNLEGTPLPVGAYRAVAAITLTPGKTGQAAASMLVQGIPFQVV